jgi:hypothetical protein
MRAVRLFVAALAMAATGCGGAAAEPTTPRSRVAKDLGCSTEATSVEEIARIPGENAARWQVRGCGKTAVYICTLPVRDCWREGEVSQPNPRPSPPAPLPEGEGSRP